MLKLLLSCTKQSQEQDLQKSMLLLRKSLTMWHYLAWNSQRATWVLSSTMPNQTGLFLSCGNCQFSSRLALLQVPSQHPRVCQRQEVASYNVGLGGLCAQPWKSHTWLFLCLAGSPPRAICRWISISKVISGNKHLDVLQMVRTGTKRNNFDSFLLLIALPPN